MLATSLLADGHQVRGTTREPGRVGEIAAVGVEPLVADPDRVATLMPALEQVTVAVILLGCAAGSQEQLATLHGSRLEMLLTKLVDTTVRAVVYEATGTVPAAILAAGATRVSAFARRSHAGGELLDADPTASQEWLQAALDAVRMALAPR